MPRGRKLVKVVEVEECMSGTAAEEFYRHTIVRGLAEATVKSYKMYAGMEVRKH